MTVDQPASTSSPTLEDAQPDGARWPGRDTYTVRVQSETGNTFDVTQNNDGTIDLTCASADDAGCPADGTWD